MLSDAPRAAEQWDNGDMLICGTCGTVNRDPGGDPRLYRCGACGQPTLQRIQGQPSAGNNNALAGAMVGATIGGVAGGPVGALVGIFIGGLLGNQVK